MILKNYCFCMIIESQQKEVKKGQWEGFQQFNDHEDIEASQPHLSRPISRVRICIEEQQCEQDQSSFQIQKVKKPCYSFQKAHRLSSEKDYTLKPRLARPKQSQQESTVKLNQSENALKSSSSSIPKHERIPLYSQQIELYPIRGRIIYKGFAARNSYQLIRHLQDYSLKKKTLLYSPSRNKDFLFNSSFECGNLNIVSRVGDREFDLYMRTDTNTNGYRQWFYFSIKNQQKSTLKLNIYRFKKKYSLFQRGMKPYAKSTKSGTGWKPVGQSVSYHAEQFTSQHNCNGNWNKTYSLSFTYEFQNDNDQVLFAACIPYSYTYLKEQISSYSDIAYRQGNVQFKSSSLTKTLCGFDVPLICISPVRKVTNKPKKYIIVSGRTHPGQVSASWVVDGLISQLVSSEWMSEWINSQNIYFKIVPMLNPDGVFCGNYRTGIIGDDFNRKFLSGTKAQFPEIHALRNLIACCKNNGKVEVFLDIHGHSVLKNSFMYGGLNSSNSKMKYLPYMVDRKCEYFSLSSSRFKSNESKIETSRIYFQEKEGILSFTCENSLGLLSPTMSMSGQLNNANKNIHMRQARQFQWQNIGHDIAHSMLCLSQKEDTNDIQQFILQERKYLDRWFKRQMQNELKGPSNDKSNYSNTLYKSSHNECDTEQSKAQFRNEELMNSLARKRPSLHCSQPGRKQPQSGLNVFKGFKIRKRYPDRHRIDPVQNNHSPDFNSLKKGKSKRDILSQTMRTILESQQAQFNSLIRSNTQTEENDLQRYINLVDVNTETQSKDQYTTTLQVDFASVTLKQQNCQKNKQTQELAQDLSCIDENFDEMYSEIQSINDSDSESDQLNPNQKRQLLKQVHFLRKNISPDKKTITNSPTRQIRAKELKQYVFSINQYQTRKNYHTGSVPPREARYSNIVQLNQSKNDFFVTRSNIQMQRSLKIPINSQLLHMRVNALDQSVAEGHSLKRKQIQKFKEKFKK